MADLYLLHPALKGAAVHPLAGVDPGMDPLAADPAPGMPAPVRWGWDRTADPAAASGGKGCLAYWFPLLNAAGVPVPRTLVHCTGADAVAGQAGADAVANLLRESFRTLADRGHDKPAPVFLRTGHTAGKFRYKETCLVTREADLADHVAALAAYSRAAGLPLGWWALREVLDADGGQGGLGRYGGWPLATEVRAWVSLGRAWCLHPYHTPAGIMAGLDDAQAGAVLRRGEILPGTTVVDMMVVSCGAVSADGVLELSRVVDAAARALPDLHPDEAPRRGDPLGWAVDVMHTTRGWVVIDAQPAFACAHPAGCPNAPGAGGGA